MSSSLLQLLKVLLAASQLLLLFHTHHAEAFHYKPLHNHKHHHSEHLEGVPAVNGDYPTQTQRGLESSEIVRKHFEQHPKPVVEMLMGDGKNTMGIFGF